MSNKSLARKNRNRYDRCKHYILKINLFKPNGNNRIYHSDILHESSDIKKGKIRNVSLSGAYGEFPHPLPGGIPVESMNILNSGKAMPQWISGLAVPKDMIGD